MSIEIEEDNMKEYIKPDLYYENFELSQHVADCAWELKGRLEQYSCSGLADEALLPYLSGKTAFANDTGACDSADYQYEGGYCYTESTPMFTLLNS